MNHIVTLLSATAIILLCCQCSPKNPLARLIRKDPELYRIASDSQYEVQVLYTTISKKNGKMQTYAWNVNVEQYFYPASTVKMPVAFLTLQKIRQLQRSGIDVHIDDDMLTAQSREAQSPAFSDSTTVSGKPNIRRYIEKIFCVSDNDAYNRLYEMLGADYINQSLYKLGLNRGTVINHRVGVSGYNYEENRYTNNIRFFRNGQMLFDKPAMRDSTDWKHKANGAVKGIGYMDSHDSLVMQPFDFSLKNFYSLPDMEGTLMRIFHPERFNPDQRFDITEADLELLKKAMSDPPTAYPFYRTDSSFHKNYVKFLVHGAVDDSGISDEVKIYNKVGNAYGYLIDCAYIEDKRSGRSFYLTAVIHVNKNQIYNDGVYEYDEIGLPFLARLGQKVLDYERSLKD
jgi:hypothetical protein